MVNLALSKLKISWNKHFPPESGIALFTEVAAPETRMSSKEYYLGKKTAKRLETFMGALDLARSTADITDWIQQKVVMKQAWMLI